MASWSRDFERAFDELFDAMLSAPWRRMHEPEAPQVRDCGDRYEIELAAPGIDSAKLNVEASRGEVVVGFGGGQAVGRFVLPGPIEVEAVSARWSDGVLLIVAPKSQRRRVPVEKIR